MSTMKRETMVREVRSDGTVRVRYVSKKPSSTRKEFAQECDINHIMNKYKKTGQISHLSMRSGRYGDFSGVMDYQSSYNAIMAADKEFESLPAKVRKRFDNDPQQLFEFLNDPKNAQEAFDLGLTMTNPSANNLPPEPEKNATTNDAKKKAPSKKSDEGSES